MNEELKSETLLHDVLGTEYEIMFGTKEKIGLSEEHMGLCKVYAKQILVHIGADDCDEKELKKRTEEIVAHELFHAYLNESGIEIDEEVEEVIANFYTKNWRKMNNSILEVLGRSGYLNK